MHQRLFLMLAAPFGVGLCIAACASIVGFPDVPDESDGGTSADAGDVRSSETHHSVGSSSHKSDAHADARSDAREDGHHSSSRHDAGHDAGVDSAPPPAESCLLGGAGLTTCGPDGGANCCGTSPVPGGVFDRTYRAFTADGGLLEGGAVEAGLPAKVSEVYVDDYVVTVGRFRQFVSAWMGVDAGAPSDAAVDGSPDAAATPSGYRPPPGSGKHRTLNGGLGLVMGGALPDAGHASDASSPYEPGWLAADDANVTFAGLTTCTNTTWTEFPGAQENLPVNCINWYESYAFCIWDGGFLPSEAEWEFTAVGGDEERPFPWGFVLPDERSAYAIYDCDYPGVVTPCADSSIFRLADVGTAVRGAGRWGQLDLAGEIDEWALDGFGPYLTPCADCAELEATSMRVIRGGDYVDTLDDILPTTRQSAAPTTRSSGIGVRCARSPSHTP